MNRYECIFNKLKIKNEGCFIPFITISYPSINIFYKIIDIFINSGVNALELGLPFSDTIADGIIVQKSHKHVLSNSISIIHCFEIIEIIRKKYYNIPIGVLAYANIIFNQGIKNFFQLCKKFDIDSILIPDVPIEESEIFEKYAKLNNISYIFICPPNAQEKLIKKISNQGTGYVYLISRTGVTGLKNSVIAPNINIIKLLKKYTTLPIIQGFGVSQIHQIKKSLSMGVNGIICGSIIMQIIQKYKNNINLMLHEIEILVQKLKQATKHV